jgi:hypothetical protein
MIVPWAVVASLGLVAALSCSSSSSTGPQSNSGASTTAFAGQWAVLSQRIVYDAGGASNVSISGTPLALGSNGTWTYGAMSDQLTVDSIAAADWTRWKASPYGPTRKLTFSGWNPGPADGPVEESGGVVNYVWVVYHVGPPTISQSGLMEIRFYHQ